MASQEIVQMLSRVGDAIDAASQMFKSGIYVEPSLSAPQLESRRKVLQKAKESGTLIKFPEIPKVDYRVVVAPNQYALLLACTGTIVVEAGIMTLRQAKSKFKTLYAEEMTHLKPALADPGLIHAWMGISFFPINSKKMYLRSSVYPVGNLKLETIVEMYKGIHEPSPTDLQMISLLADLKL